MRQFIALFLIASLMLLGSTSGHTGDVEADTLKAADVNTDGTINILDLTLVASYFGKAIAADQTPNPDVTRDGIVNILDLVLVARQMGKTVRPPVAFISANPIAESLLEANDTIALTFDNTPEDVTVSTGTATITDKIVTIAGPFAPGPLTVTITWADGSQTLPYTIRQPVAFVNAAPAAGATLDGDATITLTFDRRPEDVEVSPGDATIDGKTVKITGTFDPGNLALTITWSDGSQTLNYVVRTPDTTAPEIIGGTISDGDRDVDPEAIHTRGSLSLTFNEAVSGHIALQTTTGNDVGWFGKVQGNEATLELVKGKELGNEVTYVIVGKVRDAEGNETALSMTFTTAPKILEIPIPVNDANFDSIVLESEKPIVVEFWAGW